MNDDEFEELFNQNLQYIIGFSDLEKVFDEIAEKAKSLKTIEEMQEYMNTRLENLFNTDKTKAWNILLENLSEDFIRQYAVELVKVADAKFYPKLLGISEDGKIDNEVLKENFVGVIEAIKIKSQYDFIADREHMKIIKLLPESFIKEQGAVCFDVFSNGTYLELSTKIFKDLTPEDYPKVKDIIGWLSKNSLERLVFPYKKAELFESIINLLPRDFVKENVELFINEFGSKEKLYPVVFDAKENEEIDEKLIEKNINLFLENLDSQNISIYSIEFEHKKIIDALPNRFVRNNIEFCFSKFNKDAYSDFLAKAFTYDDDEQLDEEDIKNKLSLVKDLIDKNMSASNLLGKMVIETCWEKIIEKIPKEFISKNPEYIISLLGKKIPDESRKYFLQILPENVINDNEDKLAIKINIQNIKECKRYFEYLLNSQDALLFKSDLGTKIFNFISSEQNNTEQDVLEFKTLIENFRKNIQMPDMNKYSNYLVKNYQEELNPMDIETFESFFKDLENIKLLQGRIPEEYCDYIIKQKLTKESILNKNLNRYLPMLKRTFEDKVQHMLSKEGIEGYKIEFFENDGITLGYHNKVEKVIGFLEDNLIKLDESDSHIINTAYHEVRHAIQAKHYYSDNFSMLDGSRYNMIKEEIIRDDENAFYKRNYTRMYCEIDARLAGARGQAEYLEYLGVPTERVIEITGSTQIALKDVVEQNQIEENANIEYASNKVDKSGRIVSISQKASELIKKNPIWVKKYPVLSLEFDENGERKKSPEILSSAISCTDESIKDIYMKILGLEMQVPLEDAAETLEYVSRLLETNVGYSDDIIELIDLVIKNEIFSSLRDVNIDDIECKRIFSLLNKIAQNNPNLDISDYINENINKFLKDGKIEVEIKKDKDLSDAAISTILDRDIKTKEDFEEIFNVLSQVMIKGEKSNFKLQYGFKSLFRKYFENDPTINFNELLSKALNFVPENNRSYLMQYSWDGVPEELKVNHLKGFVELASQYRDINLDFVIETVSQLTESDFDEKKDLIEDAVGQYIPQEIFHFLKLPKKNKELKQAIEVAQKAGAEYSDLERAIKLSVIEAIRRKEPEFLEMLYTQVDFIKDENWKENAITTFFIYIDNDSKARSIEPLLKHLLLEKDYFCGETVSRIIKEAKENVDEKVLEEKPDLNQIINEIEEEALKKAKEREEALAEQRRKEKEEKNRIKSAEDLREKLNVLKDNSKYEWDFKDGIEDLMRYNMDGKTNLEISVMLDVSLKMFSSEYDQEEMMQRFWRLIPNQIKSEQINDFIETCSKYKTIDFDLAYYMIDNYEQQKDGENPTFLKEAFEKYLSPELLLFLKEIKTADELQEILTEAKGKNRDTAELQAAIRTIVEKEAEKGNPESVEMLYSQIEHIQSNLWKSSAITRFFIFATNELKIQKTEEILRHTLIETGNYTKDEILGIIDNIKSYVGNGFFDENPDLLTNIDAIQVEALDKSEQRGINLEVQRFEKDNVTYIEEVPEERISEGLKSEQLKALQKISNETPATDISFGKKMIKVFLAKARNMKNKIGKFFEGEDDHENR